MLNYVYKGIHYVPKIHGLSEMGFTMYPKIHCPMQLGFTMFPKIHGQNKEGVRKGSLFFFA